MRSLLLCLTVLIVFTMKYAYSDKHGHKQCQAHGYTGACNYRNIAATNPNQRCKDLRCAFEISRGVYRQQGIGPAAVGIKCSANHVCDSLNQCVRNTTDREESIYYCLDEMRK